MERISAYGKDHNMLILEHGINYTRGGALAVILELTDTQAIGEVQVNGANWIPAVWDLGGRVDSEQESDDDLIEANLCL